MGASLFSAMITHPPSAQRQWNLLHIKPPRSDSIDSLYGHPGPEWVPPIRTGQQGPVHPEPSWRGFALRAHPRQPRSADMKGFLRTSARQFVTDKVPKSPAQRLLNYAKRQVETTLLLPVQPKRRSWHLQSLTQRS